MDADVELLVDATVGEAETDDWRRVLRSLDAESGVVLLPDMTYPHHPSTGMVTDPAVVEWFVTVLLEHAAFSPSDIDVLCATSGEVSVETVTSLLGYDAMADEQGIDLVRASEESGLPERIRDSAVVTVLSPRFSANGREPLTHARFLRELEQVNASELGGDVRLSLLDAVFLNCGHSYEADRVFLSRDLGSIDGAIATLFGEEATTRFNETELRRIAANLDVDEPSGSGVGDAVMKFGYRLYAKASGDVVPPQMED